MDLVKLIKNLNIIDNSISLEDKFQETLSEIKVVGSQDRKVTKRERIKKIG